MAELTLLYNPRAGNFEAKAAAERLQKKYPDKINTVSIRQIRDDQDACEDLLSSDTYVLVMGGDGSFFWTAAQLARLHQQERRAVLAKSENGGVNNATKITIGPKPPHLTAEQNLENTLNHILAGDGIFQETRLPIRKIVANSNIPHPFFWSAILGEKGVSSWALNRIEFYRNSIPTFQGRFLQAVKDALVVGLPTPTNLIRASFNNQSKDVVEAVTLSPHIPYWAQFKFNSLKDEPGLLLLNPNTKPNNIRILNMITDIFYMQAQIYFGRQPTSLTGTYELHKLRTALDVTASQAQPSLILDSENTCIRDWHDIYHDPHKDNGYIKILRRVKQN